MPHDQPNSRVPPIPQRPDAPKEKSGGSMWSVFLACLGFLVIFGGLGFMLSPVIGLVFTIGIGLVFLLIVAAMAHYVLWGHWLQNAIRDEVEEEERQEAERKKGM
ncbi:MAG TPA: hypothetical protein VGJ15_08805 [Pirellulales bacterium]|jgi:hypothetical protein